MELEPRHFWGFFEWLFQQGGLLNGLWLALSLAVFGFIASYVVSVARVGPVEGFYLVCRVIGQFFTVDLPGTSLRRIYAIAKLAVKEAIRRRVIAVVGLFVIALMFAGWFMNPGAENRARLYIVFVLTGTNYLVLLLGLFVSSFSLPEEIKSKTIYSIVTKPVRPTELFLGRVVGFGAVGTVILAIIGLLSYNFVTRGLRHEHEVEEVAADGLSGQLSSGGGHTHTFEVDESGNGKSSFNKGHEHVVTRTGTGADATFVVGPPQRELTARVPKYGTLEFTDESGNPGTGISVGRENTYRDYIQGGSLASGVWTFDGITQDNFPEGITVEMVLDAFRTYKGDIVTGVRGAVLLRNPDGSAETDRNQFQIKEGRLDDKFFGTELSGFKDGEPAQLDLFKDLAPEGKLQVIIRCLDQSQYFGMAGPDVTIRGGDQPFAMNFIKGYVSIWLQFMIVVCFGVMYSTFLSGPLALVATLSTLILGFFGDVFAKILQGIQEGGGPFETLIRIVTQQGVMNELDIGSRVVEDWIKKADWVFLQGLSLISSAFPDFKELNTAEFVAYGINIFGGLMSRHLFIGLGYFILTMMVGYFFLKTREMAA